MVYVLEVSDRKGKTIYLTQERWSHIQEDHPEVSLQDLEKTLLFPTTIITSDRDEKVSWFLRHDKKNRNYLLVSVKYLNGEGFVITSHYADKIS